MSGLSNIFYDSSGQLYVDEASPMIKAVQYLPISREVEVLLSDGSRHAWRVDDLEMLANVDGQIVPLSAPTREQLIDVVPYGGGAYLYWPQIE